MPDEYTNDGPTFVKLGDVKSDGTPDIANVLFEFPVPHGQMRVTQEVEIDEAKVPGRSGKAKQAVGYQDSEISIGLVLFSDDDGPTALEKYASLQDAFRKRGEKDSLPRAFSIQSPLTDACRIQTVLFKGLEISDAEGTDQLLVTVTLVEFEPIEARVEARGGKGTSGSGSGSGSGTGSSESDKTDGQDEQEKDSWLRDAFDRGKRDSTGGDGPARPKDE